MTLEQAAAPAEGTHSTEPPAPADTGSPPEDPAGQQQKPAQSSKPPPQPSPAALMAANTRLSQQNSAIRRALGIEGKAKDEEVIAAVNALKQGTPATAEDYDPAVDEATAEFIDREWALAERIYDPDTVATARTVQELALSAASPTVFLDELSKLLPASGEAAPAPEPGTPAPTPTPQQQRAADVAPEGDGPVTLTVQPEQDEVGSGNTEGAAQSIFGSIFPGRGR